MTENTAAGWAPARAVDEAIAGSDFSGVVAVDVGSDRVYRASAGCAHRASGVLNGPDTRFAIASGSKSFTALALMRLVEDGRIELDMPIGRWMAEDLPRLDPELSIRHLLTHTGGLEDYLDESADTGPADYVLDVPVHTLTTAETYLPLLRGLGQARAPGESFTYSNAGFVILAIVLERVSGQEFQDLVAQTIFTPARLQDTAYLRLDELPASTAMGYLFASGNRANTLHLPVRGNGDGGAFTTVDDLHRFWLALFDGDILSVKSVQRMVEPVSDVDEENLRYGMGFWLERSGRGVVMEGCDAGVSFRSTHHPETQTTVTIVSNTSDGAWPLVRASLQSPADHNSTS